MRRFLIYILFLIFNLVSFAQVIENPIFDRSDQPRFHVVKIEKTRDSTFIHCTYFAEAESWANISSETYLEDVLSGHKYRIIKSDGIPFAPDVRKFMSEEKCNIKLSFPTIDGDLNRINIIEDPAGGGFNIFGIDLKHNYTSSYCEQDIDNFYNHAMEYEKKEKWGKAIEYSFKQLMASGYLYGIRSAEYSWPMFNLTMEYFGLQDYDKVIEWGEKAISILSTLQPDSINMEVLARTYGNVATAYRLKGDLASYNEYREKTLATRSFVGDNMTTYNYEEYLRILSVNCFYEEDYPKALIYGKEVASIYATKYNENPNIYGCAYVNALNNLCEFYRNMGRNKEAIECGEHAIKLIDSKACEESPWLRYYVYAAMASALSSNGDYEKAIDYYQTILDSVESNKENERIITNAKLMLASIYIDNKKDTINASTILNTINENNLGYYEHLGLLDKLVKIAKDYNSKVQYLNKKLSVQKKWNGANSMAYANSLLEYIEKTYISSLVKNDGTDSLVSHLRQSAEIIKRHFTYSIFNMSKTEKNMYWQRYKRLFTWLIPNVCSSLRNIGASSLVCDSATSLAYDACLFYKGLLLSSEADINDLIQKSNDETLVGLYKQYIENVSELEKYYSMDSSTVTIDSIKKIIRDEEILLSHKISKFNRKYKGTNYSWEDIRNKLRGNEAAIEFVSYEALDGSNVFYDAYLIKKDYSEPHYISLFVENALRDSLRAGNLNYVKLSTLIWGNADMIKELEGVKTIYFSSSGLLNAIGIEYLPVERNKYINDIYNIYRLSSTRELCKESYISTSKKAFLYGGLDYNADVASLQKTIRIEKDKEPDRLSRGIQDSINARAGFSQLNNTKYEIGLINQILTGSGYQTSLYEDEKGTEESVKNLSGEVASLIHIATHGMYIEIDDAERLEKENNFQFVNSANTSTQDVTQEDIILSRSFLVMSGGNMLIHRDSIPKNLDDGILTAKEISKLDFNELDLVVLSACQTGLGEISSEGVYGLQRGFKKAGANTILMSVDKVDDEATKILMVEFYRNLMDGKTKHQSLKNAQRYLRQVDNGKYDKPEYWASFIMLDGID